MFLRRLRAQKIIAAQVKTINDLKIARDLQLSLPADEQSQDYISKLTIAIRTNEQLLGKTVLNISNARSK